jgi:Domain of unknown function (DUF4397)
MRFAREAVKVRAGTAWHNARLSQDLPMPKLLKSLAVLLALPLVLAGCKINSINYFPPTPAHFRVVNVLGTTTPINVAVNGVTSWTGLNFEAMTGYLDFENVSTKISVSLAGSTSPLVEQTFAAVTGDQSYTIIVFGTTDAPSLGVLADATKAPPSGQYDLNLFNAAPVGNGSALGTYPIDVYVTPPGQPLDNISPTFPGVTYSNGNNFGQFPAGQYQLRMTIYGTKTVIYDSGSITFQEQTASDLIIYSRGSEVLTNALFNDSVGAGQQMVANSLLARYKVVNAAFQTGPVNALRNGIVNVSNLAYATASIYNIVFSGAATVTFEANSAPGATIASLANTFIPATDQSIFVSGFAGSTSAVALNDNNLPPASGATSVRFVNASPDSAPLDVYINDVLQVSALGTYAASAYALLPGGNTYTLKFKESTTGVTVLTLSSIALASQQTSSVYALGQAGALAGLVTADTP